MTEKKSQPGKADRELSEDFMEALTEGVLEPILELVKADNTLDLQIRDDYINIYYRGGNLLRIERNGSDFRGKFESSKYSKGRGEAIETECQFPLEFEKSGNVELWIKDAPLFKQKMDFYFKKRQNEERQAQQQMVRENNYSSQASSTDYFICDIEFAQSAESFQFDMIAAHWPSTGSSRKNTRDIGLAFIEVKYGDGALAGTAGIDKHLKDMKAFLSKRGSLQSVASQMKKVFNQKIELGLISDIKKKIDSFGTKPPEYIFILGSKPVTHCERYPT